MAAGVADIYTGVDGKPVAHTGKHDAVLAGAGRQVIIGGLAHQAIAFGLGIGVYGAGVAFAEADDFG